MIVHDIMALELFLAFETLDDVLCTDLMASCVAERSGIHRLGLSPCSDIVYILGKCVFKCDT